jgi:predicted nucleotidyltransferase
MITDKDRASILAIARKYQVSKVLLFGSSLTSHVESRDIDIAIEGLADKDYFAFYGELMCALSKPVDVVDLSKRSKFVDMVLREGVPLDA